MDWHNPITQEQLNLELSEVMPFLEDENVTEIILNPDGKLWIESRSKGLYEAGMMELQAAKSILGIANL